MLRKAELLEPSGQTGRPLAASAREARRLAAETRSKARALARSPNAKTRRLGARILASADRFETPVARSEKVIEQIRERPAGETIKERRHGLRRSRLKGGQGEHTWSGRAAVAYNAQTYRRHARAEHEHTEQPKQKPKTKPKLKLLPPARPAEAFTRGK